jgi:hypothetical protein
MPQCGNSFSIQNFTARASVYNPGTAQFLSTVMFTIRIKRGKPFAVIMPKLLKNISSFFFAAVIAFDLSVPVCCTGRSDTALNRFPDMGVIVNRRFPRSASVRFVMAANLRFFAFVLASGMGC